MTHLLEPETTHDKREARKAAEQTRDLLLASLNRVHTLLASLGAPDEPIPELGRVSIVGPVPDAPEVEGKGGVALAGGSDESGKRTYTVLVDGLNETYVLPELALSFSGWTVEREKLYPGTSLRVRVDRQGRGSVVKRYRKSK